eukprot:11155384-Lingulodinium_polyedra.AAC.1
MAGTTGGNERDAQISEVLPIEVGPAILNGRCTHFIRRDPLREFPNDKLVATVDPPVHPMRTNRTGGAGSRAGAGT